MSKKQWVLVALLVSSVFLNYIDRSNLSMAATEISRDLSMSLADLGSLSAAFFWTYALCQLFGISGWVADRYPVGHVLGGALALWSAATLASGLAPAFGSLFALRLLVGAGESLVYPCYSKILASEVRAEHRGLANALIDAGSKLGPALGTLASGLLLARYGWRVFFVALGAASLLWLIPWVLWGPRTQTASAQAQRSGPSIADIMSQRSAWGSFLGHFCGNYFWFFLLTWLPTYLIKERGFSTTEMANVTSLAYLAMAAATVTAGLISDRLIAGGASTTRVRKTVVVIGLTGSVAILPVAIVHDPTLAMCLLIAACIAFGTYTSTHWAITQTLAGPMAAGRWTSLQNGIGNLSGIVAAWLTGVVAQGTNSFLWPFLLAAAIVFTGAFMWGIVVGPVAEVNWSNFRKYSDKRQAL